METMISLEQWDKWLLEGKWTLLPFAIKYRPKHGMPADWRRAWEQAGPYSFVLESGKGGRFTFLGLNPVSVIRGKGNRAAILDLDSSGAKTVERFVEGQPLTLVQQWLEPFKSPRIEQLPKFSGGAVGFLGYDVARTLERLPELAKDDLQLDDYVWMRFEQLWVWDETADALYVIIHRQAPDQLSLLDIYKQAEIQAEEMIGQWEAICSGADRQVLEQQVEDERLFEDVVASMSQAEFEEAVRRTQDYIGAGDVFQVNLSVRQKFKLHVSPESIYEWLRMVNPSPYMGMLRFPDFQIVSASPELLVKLEKERMSTRPIAGTRKRGLTDQEDANMEAELLGNEKERAEHIMLVDLLRNDLGRVADYGSVRVTELFCIERYSHVMHLVSEVEGDLPAGRTLFDAIAAVFPGGTITGAPKIRTMEIIEELEPVTRGPYTGSMGWIDYNGNMELNIIIRTLVVKDGFGYLQAGAGIVIDSDPYREYKECRNKAKAIATAVRLSENNAMMANDRG